MLRILLIILVCACVNIYANESLEIKKILNEVSKYIQPKKKLDFLKRKSDKFDLEITKTSFNIVSIFKKAKDSFELGDSEKAIALLNLIIERYPYHKNSLVMLGNIYYVNKDYGKAKAIYTTLLKQYPGDSIIRDNFFTVFLKSDCDLVLDRMLEFYDRHKNYAHLLVNLGLLYAKKGNLVKAKEYMLSAVSIDRENPLYLYNMAVILDKLHDFENATIFYEKLLDYESFDQRQKIEKRLQSIKLR
jgi:lipopolysaccharide assembly protein B